MNHFRIEPEPLTERSDLDGDLWNIELKILKPRGFQALSISDSHDNPYQPQIRIPPKKQCEFL